MMSSIFLTIVLVAIILGKLAGIPAATEEVILVVTTLALVCGASSIFCWVVIDSL